MNNSEKFWTKISKKYAKSPIKNMEAYHKTLEAVRKHLKKTDDVLEFGCGTGSTALELANSVQGFLATDISSGMIAIGQAKAKERAIDNVSFLQAEIFDPRLQEASYDVVMGFNILHLVPDLDQVFKRVHALLKPDGLFISKTSCLNEKNVHWRIVAGVIQALRIIPYIHCFNVAQLQGFIEEAGFQTMETSIQPDKPPRLFVVAKKS